MQITTTDRDGHAVVQASGVLSVRTSPELRTALLKAAAEQPESVVCDLSAVTVAARRALTVLLAVAAQLEHWPACAFAVVVADPGVRVAVEGVGLDRRVPVAGSVTEALAAVAGGRPRPPARAVLRLAPDRRAPRRARVFVAGALQAWGEAAADVDAVALVVDELVANAVLHARTEVEVLVSARGGVVRIAVADRAGGLPEARPPSAAAESGRGLALVAALAQRWGVVPRAPSGKVVWALLAGRDPATLDLPSDADAARHPEAGGTP